MIIRQALAEASAAGTSALDASLLLAEVLNVSRSSLIAADSRPLDETSLAAFRALVKRRLSGECVAYILGRKEFYGLDFQVNPAVLVPRPDTETLVEAALASIEEIKKLAIANQPLRVLDCMRRTEGSETNTLPKQEPVRVLDCMRRTEGSETNTLPKQEPVRVLDLCTGSGAVAVVLKHTLPELEVWATDISVEALAVARANAARLLPPDSIHFCHGDLFGALPSPFRLIVSNPPYVPTAEIAGLTPEVRGEPLLALDGGDDGLAVISRIISGAPQFLSSGGILLLEADPRQMKRIAALLQQAGGPLVGFRDIQTRRDLSGAERVIEAKFFALS
jgi:release factor glutamine methyltransferase